MMARAIRMERHGGPEVLQMRDIDIGSPGAGQVLVRQTACGLNFLDVYHRSGAYPLAMPSGCGSEAAGIVEALGPDVSAFRVGDRVAYQGGEPGAYADLRILPGTRLVKVPDGVTDEQAAAVLLKGMTVEYLLNRCVTLRPGDFALMYAAAGGIGLLAGQWAKHLGINLIGVASGDEKCAKARSHGYFAVIDRDREDIVARVKELTGGNGLAGGLRFHRPGDLRHHHRVPSSARRIRLVRRDFWDRHRPSKPRFFRKVDRCISRDLPSAITPAHRKSTPLRPPPFSIWRRKASSLRSSDSVTRSQTSPGRMRTLKQVAPSARRSSSPDRQRRPVARNPAATAGHEHFNLLRSCVQLRCCRSGFASWNTTINGRMT